ncbi:MAG: ABC transporter substrate-binding protein [Acidimicrobiia bacterium]|nr:ABC transporter substrate-binding protein [Acidimicrobiia bacterium]
MRRRLYRWMTPVIAFVIAVATACSDPDDGDAVPEAPTTTVSSTAPPTTLAAETTAAPETTTSTTEAGSNRQYGGEVVVGGDEPPTLNPFVQGGGTGTTAVIGQCYNAGVSDIDGFTLERLPDLVTELPTVGNGGVIVNEDGSMTVSYKIRDEAVWSDGTPISGEDFQFTLDTIMDSDLALYQGTYEDIISTEVGAKTFSLTLSFSTVLHETLFPTVLPKHDVEGSEFLTDWNDTMWVSSGPFILDTWQKGDFVRVVRNENYWRVDDAGRQLPYLDSVVFRFIDDDESKITAFASREVDVINPNPGTGAIERLQTLESEGAIVEVLSGAFWEHLNFQFGPGRLGRNENSANHNLNYRKGVAHTINKDLIVDEILAGQVEPLESFVQAYSPTLSTGAWSQYDYNPSKAVEYFEAAKAELGVDDLYTVFSTTSNNDARVKLSELFVNMFEEVGVVYENQLEDSQLFFGETFSNGIWDLGEWAWLGSPDLTELIWAYDLFDPEAPPPDGANYYHWGTPESGIVEESTVRFAEIRDALNSSVDRDVLIPLIQEGEQILADQVVIIPLFARLATAAVWGDEVGGFKHNPTGATYTWNIEEWHRVDL